MTRQEKYNIIMEYIVFEYGTQAAFAKAMNVLPQEVSRWLHGGRRISGTTIQSLRKHGVPMNVIKALYFLYDNEKGEEL